MIPYHLKSKAIIVAATVGLKQNKAPGLYNIHKFISLFRNNKQKRRRAVKIQAVEQSRLLVMRELCFKIIEDPSCVVNGPYDSSS